MTEQYNNVLLQSILLYWNVYLYMFSLNSFKSVKLLHDKKNRHEECIYIAEGSRLVHDLIIHNPMDILGIYATKKWIQSYDAKLQNFGNLVVEVSDSQLQSLATLKSTHEVLAILKFPNFESLNYQNLPILSFYLDQISDPGNFGTIIRTADWFGIGTLFCSPLCADTFNSKVVQASMGSVSRIQILVSEIEELKDKYNYQNYVGADLSGINYNDFKPEPYTIICMGNEANGISEQVRIKCSQFIHIPSLSKGAESLNVAISTGIIMAKFCI